MKEEQAAKFSENTQELTEMAKTMPTSRFIKNGRKSTSSAEDEESENLKKDSDTSNETSNEEKDSEETPQEDSKSQTGRKEKKLTKRLRKRKGKNKPPKLRYSFYTYLGEQLQSRP